MGDAFIKTLGNYCGETSDKWVQRSPGTLYCPLRKDVSGGAKRKKQVVATTRTSCTRLSSSVLQVALSTLKTSNLIIPVGAQAGVVRRRKLGIRADVTRNRMYSYFLLVSLFMLYPLQYVKPSPQGVDKSLPRHLLRRISGINDIPSVFQLIFLFQARGLPHRRYTNAPQELACAAYSIIERKIGRGSGTRRCHLLAGPVDSKPCVNIVSGRQRNTALKQPARSFPALTLPSQKLFAALSHLMYVLFNAGATAFTASHTYRHTSIIPMYDSNAWTWYPRTKPSWPHTPYKNTL